MNAPTPEPGAGSGPSDLPARIVSAIALVLIAAYVTWAGGSVFAVAMMILSGLVFYEWTRITFLPTHARSVWISAALLLAGIVTLATASMFAAWTLVLAGAGALLALAASRLMPKLRWARAKWAAGGLVYAFACGTALITIRGDGTTPDTLADLAADPGLVLLSYLFLTVWATDICAYFVGRAVGGPKLMPKVSPKKTISGALGGLAGAFLVGLVFVALVDEYLWQIVFPLSLFLSAVSQAGDLFESWVKRRYDKKDSSRLIPGHGGFMDRIDGLVFAAVPLALFVGFAS